MKLLCDSNVFLALTLDNHPHHTLAVAWMEALPEDATAYFCRATQQAYLRLLTVEPMLKSEVRSNNEALEAWNQLRSDSRVGFVPDEPSGLEARWLTLAGHSAPAPKRWMTRIWQRSRCARRCVSSRLMPVLSNSSRWDWTWCG